MANPRNTLLRFNLANGLLGIALALFLSLFALCFWPASTDHLIPVCNTWGRYGYVNENGRLIIPCQFEWAGPFGIHGTALVHTLDDHAVFIDKSGNIKLQVPMTPLHNFDKHGMCLFLQNGKFGWIDQQGNILIQPTWEWACSFDDHDMAYVESPTGAGIGWIDRKGQNVIPCKWRGAASAFDAQGWIAVPLDDHIVFIDRQGNVVLTTTYQTGSYHNFDSHGWALMRTDKKWDWIDRQGKVHLTFEADECSDFDSFGWAAFRRDKTIGWINRQGQVTLTMPLDQCCSFQTREWAVIFRNQRCGVIDRQGQEIIPPVWNRGIFQIDPGDPHSPIWCSGERDLPAWLDAACKKVFQWLGKPWKAPLRYHLYNSRFELIWRSDDWLNFKEWYLGLTATFFAILGTWMKLKTRKKNYLRA